MKRGAAKKIAFGGVMAALAVVVMCLGTMIPVATFVCPMICAMILALVHGLTGTRVAWAWYGAVSILSLLLAPDKEAAAVFVFLGYYPIVKPWIDRGRLPVVWKLALFNISIFAMYSLLIRLFGMDQILAEFQELGTVMTVVTLALGNVTLFMLDVLLGRLGQKMSRRKG